MNKQLQRMRDKTYELNMKIQAGSAYIREARNQGKDVTRYEAIVQSLITELDELNEQLQDFLRKQES